MQNQIDAALAAASGKISKGGAVTAIGGWAISSDTAALCGLVIAVLGYLTSLYYHRRRDRREQEKDRREQEEHEARMKGLLQ